MGDARIVLDGWGWRHAGRRAWAVAGVSLAIEQGERVLLLGSSGAGKSTLLHALAGVLGDAAEGEEAGTVRLGDAHPAAQHGRTGLVMQDPEAAVVLARVGDDVAFGLENLGVPRDEIWPRVGEALAAVALDVTLDRSTERLSGGQKQRLALAGALAMRPDVLLLDEPTANLDPDGIVDVRDAVARAVAGRRTTLVVVEHRIDVWLDLIDRVIVIAPGAGVIADGPPSRVFADVGDELAAAGAWVPGHPPAVASRTAAERSASERLGAGGSETPALATEALTIGYDQPVQEGLTVAVPAGTSTVITGANGSGKTTLALTLAGLLPPLAGGVRAAPWLAPMRKPAPITWRSKELLTRIGTVFQEPEHQFVAATVFDEIAVGLRALGRPAAEIEKSVAELLDLLRLGRLAQANPFTLSGGEKRRLSVGTVLATRPRVLVLDEPTFGQDRTTWVSMVMLVQQQLAEGNAVVSVTHDPHYMAVLGEQRIVLEGRGQ